MKKIFLFFILFILSFYVKAQNCSVIQWASDIPSTCSEMTMTMRVDLRQWPYLYIAGKEAGLKVYDITDISNPVHVLTIPVTQFDSLDIMNINQDGDYLFITLGNHFNNTQHPGMAIVDVTNPASAFVTDTWTFTSAYGGAGIVKTEGNIAYLGAMGNGLVILDFTDKYNIQFVSQFIPDINYPDPNPNPALYNARGMMVKDSIVYLCYDAGGLRIINCKDALNIVETGHYSNPVMNGLPRAYNNIILQDTLVYIAVDYCGMEILNILDTSNITQVSWWNPWNCQGSPLNWFSSDGHTNEIAYNGDCNLICLATGKSDLHVVDVSDPYLPDSCNYYGGTGNNIGTWGISISHTHLMLSYVCAIIPFSSNWTGVKLFSFSMCYMKTDEEQSSPGNVYPNPAAGFVTVTSSTSFKRGTVWKLYNLSGQPVLNGTVSKEVKEFTVDIQSLTDGFYTLEIGDHDTPHQQKLMICRR